MKKLLIPAALPIILFAMSFGNMEMKKIDMTQVSQFEDSILHGQIVPGVNSIHTLQDDDFSKVAIIVTDAPLYSDKDKIQQSAIRTGMMVLRVLGPDNSLSKGTFVVSNTMSDKNEMPADGINADMKLDSLKKVVFPGK